MTNDNPSTIYVDGAWRAGLETFSVRNPATGESIGTAGDAGTALALEALDGAHRAFPAWRATSAEERGLILRSAASILRDRLEDLALLLTRENGKPLAESRGELMGTARTLEWAAEEGRRAYGRSVPATGARRAMVWHSPVGVTVAISPWNFPVSMLARKIALALAAGCTVVAKPAEETPLIARELVRAFEEAGTPAGVLNLVTTSRPDTVVAALLADDRVAKLTFTGSTEVGLHLSRNLGETVKRVSLELGGNAPFIVLPDADLDLVVEDAVDAKFKNAGQSCIAVNRLFVHTDVADEVTERIALRAASLIVGDGTDPATQIGPLIDDRALEKVQHHVDDALRAGATVIAGGTRCAEPPLQAGAFYRPTVISGVSDDMLLAREETFGPVLPILEFGTEDEVVARANDSSYGLAAYVYGSAVSRLWRVAEALDYGVIGINDPVPIMPELPFGGMKNSGQEREGGTEGVDAYLEAKSVSLRI